MRKLAAGSLVFLGGFAIMVLEIIGARFLAKDFGGSFYVWVSQIGVILIALALGYYVGGALADRFQRISFLAYLLVPAGVVTAFIPDFAPPLIDAIILRHPIDQPIPLAWQKLDPALGSALIFLLPCFVLATLSPYVIRLATKQLAHVGRISGLVIAASTVGSIVGVFVSGYVLIDQLKMSDIFRATGGLTVFLGALCFLLDRSMAREEGSRNKPEKEQRVLFAAVLCAALLRIGNDCSAGVIFETTSPYHHIQVVDEQGIRTLSFDGSAETRMSLANPLHGHFEYTEYFHMPWLWNTTLTNVLMIGLGGASTQRAYQHYYPDVTVQTVDIDPAVVAVAKQYFGFQESQTQRVEVADGRVFLRRDRTRYGAIIIDAYTKNRYGSFIPYHLATKEFFELADQHLATNGVLAYNVIGTFQGWRADVLGSIYKTMKGTFPQVYLFPAQESLNVVLIGLKSNEKLDRVALQRRATALVLRKRVQLPTFSARLLSMRTEAPLNFQRCQALTDDYAPVDGLLTRGR